MRFHLTMLSVHFQLLFKIFRNMHLEHVLSTTWLCFLDFKLICIVKLDLGELWIITADDAMLLGWSFLTSEWQFGIFKLFFLMSFLKHNEKSFLMLSVAFSSVACWGNGIYCKIKQFWHSCAASNRLKTSKCHNSFTAAIPVLTSARSFRAAYIHLSRSRAW